MTRIVEGVDLDGPLPGVTYQIKDRIAYLTLNRPEQGNSLGEGMSQAFKAMWSDVRDNQDIIVAIITGTGERHFCTGASVAGLSTEKKGSNLRNLPVSDNVFWSSHQNRVWKPVICGLNGLVCGAGLHFAVDADIIVASENVTILDTHVNVGQVGAIENIGLTKRLPLGSALRMTLQGRNYRMPAKRAYDLGFVDELVAKPADVLPKCEEIARDMLKNSPAAMMASKEALWKAVELGYTAAVEYGWALLRNHWAHPDFVEGPRAFGEKREPQWNPDPSARR